MCTYWNDSTDTILVFVVLSPDLTNENENRHFVKMVPILSSVDGLGGGGGY